MKPPPHDPFRCLDDPAVTAGKIAPRELLPGGRLIPAGEQYWMLEWPSERRPNWFRRFWAWALLGGRWKRVD